jgi:hypothetical protein
VYPVTAAGLGFLVELAAVGVTPGRAGVVTLLVSIGGEVLERGFEEDGTVIEYAPLRDARRGVVFLRECGGQFAGFACDSVLDVCLAAVGGLGVFLDDAGQAAAVLRGRLVAEDGVAAWLRTVEAAATLALRFPAASHQVAGWLAVLVAGPVQDSATRLAALVQLARCAPDEIGEDVVPAAVGLLRETARALPVRPIAPAPSPPAALQDAMAPQIAAAFAGLDHHTRVDASTTDLLRTFHEVLGARV